ncbi:MAG TPA: biopolymer transporter ExbD [Gemmatimonadaceae bacterium]|nr:biopolymer transporter ExbD [Gemmatimonadaceae bacterium]
MSRGREMRANRRAAQFAKFRITELNLVPLVDTMVSIVFFALVTQTVGELTTVVPGVDLPTSRVGAVAHQQLTLGITSSQVTLGGHTVMGTGQAATARSNVPGQPLVIPQLYGALKTAADSIRKANKLPEGQSVETPLAIQGDKSMRYALMARMIQTARLAGFKTLSLQVNKTQEAEATPAGTPGS